MTHPPEIEVGTAVASGHDSFEAAAGAARQARDKILSHPLSVVFVYASVAHDLGEVLRGVASVVGDAPVIGATTAGEICGGAHRNSIVVSIWASPHMVLRRAIGRNVAAGWERALDEATGAPAISEFFEPDGACWPRLASEGKSVFAMVFAPGNSRLGKSRAHEIVERLKSRSDSRFPILATAAADDLKMESNFILHGSDAVEDGLLVAMFETRLQFGIALSHGFAPTTDIVPVTAASGYELLGVGGEPAAEALPRLLGSTRAAMEGKHVSLASRRVFGRPSGLGQYTILVGRYLTPGGGCSLSHVVEPGTALTVMEPLASSMRHSASEALRNAILRGGITKPAVAMLGYSAFRLRFLGPSASVEEIEAARTVLGETPFFGFFCFGEGGVSDDGVSRFCVGAVAALVIGGELSPIARLTLEAERLRGEIERRAEELEARADESLLALRQSEERFQLAMRGSNYGLWDWDLRTGEMYYSPSWKAMLGFDDDAVGCTRETWRTLVHPDDVEATEARVDECVAGLEKYEVEYRIRRKGGLYLDIVSRAVSVLDEQGKVVRLVGTHVDISDHKRVERSLRQAAAVFNSTDEGIMVTDAHAKIVSVNRAFCEITGYSETEFLMGGFALLKSGRQGAEFYREMWRAIVERGHWQGELWNRRKNGEIYPQWLTVSEVRDDNGVLVNYVGVFSDITRLKESERRMQHIAHHDPLTDLPNRLLLAEFLDQAVSRAHRSGAIGAVLFLDLDRFKNVNDSFGHGAGDELLALAVRRLEAQLRATDLLSRHGGDEFVAILEDLAHPEDAGRVAEKLIAALSETPFVLSCAPEIFIGASVGISLFPTDGETATELIQYADAALYDAKAHGRGTYRYFDRALTSAAEKRLGMEARLRRALDRGEFVLYYQPLVDLSTGRIHGVEALARWLQPEYGLVSPDQFIPLAEETGLIIPLGLWILHEACAQAKRWDAMGFAPLTMSVNLSPRQFECPSLIDDVGDVLRDTGLTGDRLELELTESALMRHGPAAAQKLDALKALGLRLAIDDFGTGYSSFAYLKRMPLDRLKIDRSFVQDITEHSADAAIVSTIIDLAKCLGFDVVAEGIESMGQVAALQARGCEFGQGYFFARPMAPEDLVELLCLSEPRWRIGTNAAVVRALTRAPQAARARKRHKALT